MFSAAVRMLILVCLMVLPTAIGEGPAPEKPLAVTATPKETSTAITWIPSPDSADFFIIYGLVEGAKVPLATSSTPAAEVDSGYLRYGVAAVRGGIESETTSAMALIDPECVVFIDSLVPPRIFLGCNKVVLRAKTWLP